MGDFNNFNKRWFENTKKKPKSYCETLKNTWSFLNGCKKSSKNQGKKLTGFLTSHKKKVPYIYYFLSRADDISLERK